MVGHRAQKSEKVKTRRNAATGGGGGGECHQLQIRYSLFAPKGTSNLRRG